jgi:hypothetical protein
MRDPTYLRIVASVHRPVYRSAYRSAVRGRLVDPDEPRGRRFHASDVDELLAATWGRPGDECQTIWGPDAGYTTFTSCAPLNFVRQLIEEQGDDGELAFFERTFCTFDWPLVDFLVGRPARYERPHTLSFGDDRCDMLWSATPPLTAAPSTRSRRLATNGGG